MLSARYLLVPFVLQLSAMAADEIGFHWKRRLPRWERIGHPLDTLTVLACFAWLLLYPPNGSSIGIYAGLCVFSCLFVTKDEWVHHHCCTPGEHWLHAVLFILHPLVLLSAGMLWVSMNGSELAPRWLRHDGYERAVLLGNAALTLLFGLYQLVYWNLIWRSPLPDAKTIR